MNIWLLYKVSGYVEGPFSCGTFPITSCLLSTGWLVTISACNRCQVETYLCSLCSLGVAASDRLGSSIMARKVLIYCGQIAHYASVRMCRRHTVVGLCVCVCVCTGDCRLVDQRVSNKFWRMRVVGVGVTTVWLCTLSRAYHVSRVSLSSSKDPVIFWLNSSQTISPFAHTLAMNFALISDSSLRWTGMCLITCLVQPMNCNALQMVEVWTVTPNLPESLSLSSSRKMPGFSSLA